MTYFITAKEARNLVYEKENQFWDNQLGLICKLILDEAKRGNLEVEYRLDMPYSKAYRIQNKLEGLGYTVHSTDLNTSTKMKVKW